jgi:hypothetical protein
LDQAFNEMLQSVRLHRAQIPSGDGVASCGWPRSLQENRPRGCRSRPRGELVGSVLLTGHPSAGANLLTALSPAPFRERRGAGSVARCCAPGALGTWTRERARATPGA